MKSALRTATMLSFVCCVALGCSGLKRKMNAEKTELGAGSKVTLSTETPPAACRSVGLVTYNFFKGTLFPCDYNDAQNSLRNQAAARGANYLKLVGIRDAGVYCQGSGEAYACPEDALPDHRDVSPTQ